MKKLSKEQLKSRDELTSRLRDRRENLDNAIDAYKERVENAWADIVTELEAYNEVLSDVKSWAQDDVAQSIQEYMDERSDKWQESDKAQAYSEWRDAFSDLECDTVSCEKPDELEIDLEQVDDLVEVIGQLPEELGE